MKVALYTRISTADQNPELQLMSSATTRAAKGGKSPRPTRTLSAEPRPTARSRRLMAMPA